MNLILLLFLLRWRSILLVGILLLALLNVEHVWLLDCGQVDMAVGALPQLLFEIVELMHATDLHYIGVEGLLPKQVIFLVVCDEEKHVEKVSLVWIEGETFIALGVPADGILKRASPDQLEPIFHVLNLIHCLPD